MPYGMTYHEWAWRYANRQRNRIVQTTDCPRCHHGPGKICTTITGNSTNDIHLVRVQAYESKWLTHHTPDGQPL